MAGTDKSYWRHTSPSSVVKQAINSQGVLENYTEYTQFKYNHIPGNHVMDSVTGICSSNSGMDTSYYQHEQYRTQTVTVKSAKDNTGRTVSYNEYTNSTSGKQGTFHGDTGLPK